MCPILKLIHQEVFTFTKVNNDSMLYVYSMLYICFERLTIQSNTSNSKLIFEFYPNTKCFNYVNNLNLNNYSLQSTKNMIFQDI